MDEFEKWFNVYKKTINSLQKQKISSSETRIKTYSESLEKAEKTKGKTYEGQPKDEFISKVEMSVRQSEDLIRRSKKIIKDLDERGAKFFFSQLERHSMFDSMVPDSATGDLNLYTKNLTYRSKPLGRYRIVLKNTEHNLIYVVNIDYDRGSHDHWAINGLKCCFGDWGDDVVKVTNEGNLYGIFDLLVMFLQTAGHKSAYMRDVEWIKSRVKVGKEASEKKEFARLEILQRNQTWPTTMITPEVRKTMTTMIQKLPSKYEKSISQYFILNEIKN